MWSLQLVGEEIQEAHFFIFWVYWSSPKSNSCKKVITEQVNENTITYFLWKVVSFLEYYAWPQMVLWPDFSPPFHYSVISVLIDGEWNVAHWQSWWAKHSSREDPHKDLSHAIGKTAMNFSTGHNSEAGNTKIIRIQTINCYEISRPPCTMKNHWCFQTASNIKAKAISHALSLSSFLLQLDWKQWIIDVLNLAFSKFMQIIERTEAWCENVMIFKCLNILCISSKTHLRLGVGAYVLNLNDYMWKTQIKQ